MACECPCRTLRLRSKVKPSDEGPAVDVRKGATPKGRAQVWKQLVPERHSFHPSSAARFCRRGAHEGHQGHQHGSRVHWCGGDTRRGQGTRSSNGLRWKSPEPSVRVRVCKSRPSNCDASADLQVAAQNLATLRDRSVLRKATPWRQSFSGSCSMGATVRAEGRRSGGSSAHGASRRRRARSAARATGPSGGASRWAKRKWRNWERKWWT